MNSILLIFCALIAITATTNAVPINMPEMDPEQGDFFEGDMILDNDQMEAIMNSRGRNMLRDEKYHWKDAKLYYELDYVFDEEQLDLIYNAMDIIEKDTCIRILPKEADTQDYVKITGFNTGCHATVGHQGGEQVLNLQLSKPGQGCFMQYKIVHEFLHTLGFYHQQSATNRDDYVRIVEENIKDGRHKAFKKHDITHIEDFGVPYDYESVMHYGEYHFTKNGLRTIVPLQQGARIGQRQRITELDILKLNLLYCNKKEN